MLLFRMLLLSCVNTLVALLLLLLLQKKILIAHILSLQTLQAHGGTKQYKTIVFLCQIFTHLLDSIDLYIFRINASKFHKENYKYKNNLLTSFFYVLGEEHSGLLSSSPNM